MNTLILIVLLVGAVIGFYQGAFKQIANFAGVFVGLIVASRLSSTLGEYLADKTGQSVGVGQCIAFVLIVIVVPFVLGWIATLLTKVFSALHIGFVNRLAGAGIGIISYCLVLSFAFNMMDFMTSNGGYNTEKLEEREASFYAVKHASQPIIPDLVIVDDSTEVAALGPDETPRFGLKSSVDKAINKILK